jgi:hypothetical protein
MRKKKDEPLVVRSKSNTTMIGRWAILMMALAALAFIGVVLVYYW